MPDYKKRKRNKILSPPKTVKKSRVKKDNDNDIKMTSGEKKQYRKTNNIKVIEGRKLERKRKLKVYSVIVAVLLAVILILQCILPAGIIESVKIGTKLLGAGSYPVTLAGSQTLNTVSKSGYYYVLSNSHLTAFSNSGKTVFNFEHGFEKPVLKTSAGGALVYNQGSKEVLVFDINGLKHSFLAENNILAANISNLGSFAVATVSDKYASAVTVYNNNAKKIYEWYSAEDTVNAVALSKNGKKLAVSVFNSQNGEFVSKVNVLNFKSATPEYSEAFENTYVYNLHSDFSNGFAVITSNKIKFIKWRGFKFNEYKSDYTLSIFKSFKNGYVAVFNRQSDKTDNKIAVLSSNGKIKYEVTYSGIISDITVSGSHIYCMSDTEILVVNKDGNLASKTNFGFGGVGISVLSSNQAAVITDNKIEKIKLDRSRENEYSN